MANTTGKIKVTEEPKVKDGYNPLGEERKVWEKYQIRKQELLKSRKNVMGLDIDARMRSFDKQYFNRVADIPASELDANQRPIAINNAFGKVQTALSLLIDKNPTLVLDENNPKYSANRELVKALAQKSFKNTNSLGQFKLSVFNAARRGWMVGRTFNRRIIHPAKFLVSVDDKGNRKYDQKMITKMDDIAYMNLDNFNAWIDEQSRPEDMLSTRDWMWREVWHIDDVRRIFPVDQFPNMEHVHEGGDTRESLEGTYLQSGTYQTSSTKETKQGMTEMFFYEHQYDDWFIIEINGVMIVWEPLPQDHKRLSCVYAPWHFRSDNTIYGIGIIEEMERNEELADRIINMTMRQLLLTIAPPGFYSGTEDFEDDNIKLRPGIMRRALDPQNIQWMEIPPGNQHGLEMIEWLDNKSGQITGINKIIEGDNSPTNSDTAFELGINREASLKRLRIPLKSLQYALDWEFRNRIALIKQTYSDYKVEHLATEEEIFDYLDEVNADPDFFYIENEGEAGSEKFYAKKYKQVQLNLEQDQEGNFIESDEKKFFNIKPEYLAFEGDISIDISSLLIQSEELEKADVLRMANLLIPLLPQPVELVGKPVKQLLLAFNKDPKNWVPQTWLDFYQQKGQQESQAQGQITQPGQPPAGGAGQLPLQSGPNPQLVTPTGANPNLPASQAIGGPISAQTVIPAADLASKPTTSGRFGAAFKAFKNP